MGHLQRFHEKYGKDGLLVFAIAMQDEPEEARKTTKEKGWNYPVFNGLRSALGEKFAYG